MTTNHAFSKAPHIVNLSIRGEFNVDVVRCDAEGNWLEKPRRVITAGNNLITNVGMDRFGTNDLYSLSTYLHVGTGNTAPSNTDTALVDKVAAVSGGSPSLAWDTTSPKSAVFTRIYTFPTGAAAGVLNELGLAVSLSGTLTTRALFVDGSGTPTAITVLSDEQLIVTYRLIFTASETDATFVTTQQGTEYTLTLRPANLSVTLGADGGRLSAVNGVSGSALLSAFNDGAALGTVTGRPSGTENLIFSAAQAYGTYTPGTYYRDDTISLTPSQGNFANVTAYELAGGTPFCLQIGISPPVSKTSSDSMGFTIRTSWARG